MTKLLHQLGYNFKWNLRSLAEDKTGDGVITSPRHMTPEETSGLPLELRQASVFDPQFFVLSTAKGDLSKYNFFPKNMVGTDAFSTSEYADSIASKSAELCLDFQLGCRFRYCVAPTRYRKGSPSDFVDSQMKLFVLPFLEACGKVAEHPPLLLQLILTDDMIKDDEARDLILNWVTSLREFAGVYLIPCVARRGRQLDDIDFLLAFLNFVTVLRENNLEVMIGYQNTEALIMLAADPTYIATGAYEKQRIFRPEAFEEDEPRRGSGGNIPVRIYIPRLLQWVDSNYLGSIIQHVSDPAAFFGTEAYEDLMFKRYKNWHFNQPQPYFHYFRVFARQFRNIASLEPRERFLAIRDSCQIALDEFAFIEGHGILLDADSGKNHLPKWITVLNQFGKEQGFIP